MCCKNIYGPIGVGLSGAPNRVGPRAKYPSFPPVSGPGYRCTYIGSYVEVYNYLMATLFLQSTPPLPPKLNYADIQLDNKTPKSLKADNHVTYTCIETNPI